MMEFRVLVLMLVATFLYPTCVESRVRNYKFSAWSQTTQDRLVRWASIYHTMPDSDRAELYLQLHPHRAERHTSLACTYKLATSNSTWRHRHFTQAWCSLSVSKPDKEEVIIFGEWWKSDVEAVINQAMKSGQPPNISDAHTINGLPGPAPNCSSQGYTLQVESGKTYLLRIVNAAVNEELFFKIAGHQLTVVEVDATYTKPFKTDTIFIGPGQTTNALLTADQKSGNYLIAISPFMDTIVAIDNQTATGTLSYKGMLAVSPTSLTAMPPKNATPITSKFMDSLRSLNSKEYPANVPQTVDHSLVFAIGVGVNPCSTCVNGSRVVADINNVSFVMPTTAILQAHYYNINGVYTDDFPANPPNPYNYTGTPPTNLQTNNGTKVYRLAYNSTVQLVLQGTSIIAPESHPTHLHGFNFYVVGKGLGNYDPKNDPKKFNLVDPVERNTISVPTGGWTAIRFRADNPGTFNLFISFFLFYFNFLFGGGGVKGSFHAM
ncbi:UNVERIFIED_CONTAM: Laccase-22 [Sesamum radiatum]|uniref:Laccase n=1 Tax=Sesamum radiatum TaxID=300843 RepID=A0AAW2THA7_SESRA